MIKTLLFLSLIFIALAAHSEPHSVSLKNSSTGHVTFVRYDVFGNYKQYPIPPGKSLDIQFDEEYLNLLALENDQNVPYFLFDSDAVEITGANEGFYTFNSKDPIRTNELRLSTNIFRALMTNVSPEKKLSFILDDTRLKLDSLFAQKTSGSISSEFKKLIHSYYHYDLFEKKVRVNATHNISDSFDQQWQPRFDYALQSYILAFRTYILNYLPQVVGKQDILKECGTRFSNEYREIALYTITHMAYYRDKNWFRSHVDEYLAMSPNPVYSDRISYLKLTDELSGKSGEIVLINSSTDTLGFADVLARLKGKVVLVDLWASWCIPCIEQFPFSDTLATVFKSQPFELLYLNMDRELALFTFAAAKYLKGKLSYSIIGNFNSSFAVQYKISAIPRYMVFDKTGKLINEKAPFPNNNELRLLIQKHL